MSIQQVPAHPANYSKGRYGHTPELLVVHLMDGTLEGTDAWFADPRSSVSAHYGIGQKGERHQYVQETDTAWHAGRWSVNLRSIGLEHEGRQVEGSSWQPTNPQFWASVELAAQLCARWGITPNGYTIIPHSSVDPPRRAHCPGSGFPLDRYIEAVRERTSQLLRDAGVYVAVRLFDPETNKQIGDATLIRGTDKVYVKELFKEES